MERRRLAGGLLAAVVFAVIGAPQAGAAQVDYYLKISGIEGESTAKGHEGEIVIDSFSWGLSNTASRGAGGGAGAGKVDVQDFSFTKKVDRSSPLLMRAVAEGRPIECARLTARKPGREPQGFLVYEFSEVLVTKYQTAGSAGDVVPTDSFSLNFSRIRFEHSSQSSRGVPQRTAASWDFLTREQFSTQGSC